MSYKVVKNAEGKVVAFGPNDNNYEPTIKVGETLTIEETLPKIIKEDLTERIAARQAVLDRLGLTEQEAQLLLGS